MEEAAPFLHMSGRLVETGEIFLSLSTGAILLIATFLRDPPQVKGAKWHVLFGLVGFTFCFLTAIGTVLTIHTYEAFVFLELQQEARLGSDQKLEQAFRAFEMTIAFFGVGVASMLSLAMRIASSWKNKPAPSS